jgi:cytochrome d ubiquinol oxidase subunit I
LARRAQDALEVFLILTGVFGAVTGVGIWFAIGLASPESTSALIHNFVFGWAMEWCFFIVEIATAIVYYYTWDRIPAEQHCGSPGCMREHPGARW